MNAKYLTLEAFQSYVTSGYKARKFVFLEDMTIDKVKEVLIFFKDGSGLTLLQENVTQWFMSSITRALMVHY